MDQQTGNPFVEALKPSAAQARGDGPPLPSDLSKDPLFQRIRERNQQSYPYTFQHDVFVVFRPWESCFRCGDLAKRAREAEEADSDGETPEKTWPDEGDMICPHTRRNEYLALWEQILSGQIRYLGHKEETLKNGVTRISIEWAIPKNKAEPAKGPVMR